MCPNAFQHINARFCCSRKERTKERKQLHTKRTASAAPYKPKKIPVARTVSKSTRHMIYAFFRSFPPRNLIEVLLFRVSLRERSRHRIGLISIKTLTKTYTKNKHHVNRTTAIRSLIRRQHPVVDHGRRVTGFVHRRGEHRDPNRTFFLSYYYIIL